MTNPTTTRPDLLSGWQLAEPMREYVTEQGCVVRWHARINAAGERVEHVTLCGGPYAAKEAGSEGGLYQGSG
jgi:hypothetical protein